MQPDHEAEMTCYRQVQDAIKQVKGLSLALHELERRADEVAIPVAAADALHIAIGRALDDAGSMLEAHYHPRTWRPRQAVKAS
ncbi:hypothetical protein ROLI_008890 [Roseobacter fucihabitans]|uniref:Uncharacterized protein n=1 Tax=Roseobacter fucihabitans TaxID=1537242 RepID=A0ABZ2BRG6_9RHOB|nr:hypothetical protein [Roseobacter litoralis]MBC6968347.1 hypothetical protein [Roseobacter litoralis]